MTNGQTLMKLIQSCHKIWKGIIFYQMFELCKKVEVYHIENNYYYLNPRGISSELKQKLGLHLLKPVPIRLVTQTHNNRSSYKANPKNSKRGIKLSKTINCIPSGTGPRKREERVMSQTLATPVKIMVGSSAEHQLGWLGKNELSRLRTDTEYNANVQDLRWGSPVTSKRVGEWQQQSAKELHAQKIDKKVKPSYNVTPSETITMTMTSPKFHKEASSQTETNKNLSDTKPPISSKIETSCTNGIFSSQHIVSKYEPEMNNLLRESFENSSSKLISISKSVSSLHETLYEKDQKKLDMEGDQAEKSGQEISINLSNIFSKEDGFGVDNGNRRLSRETPMKRLSLWQDSDRHTIQSRFSRQFQPSEHEIKIQQSLIQDYDPKQNFHILQLNQIRKKDFLVSLAIEKHTHCLVSLKEFISNQTKLVVEELQVYELLGKHMDRDGELYGRVLELYQVQRSQGSHMLIKQPYQISMQARLKTTTPQQSHNLREKAKQISSILLKFLQKYHIFPNRKLTTHQFVICCGIPKIHDFTLFKALSRPVMNQEEVLEGIDI